MHFDYPVHDESLFDRIKSEVNFVASYRFLPYIRIEIPTYKFNGEKVKRKTRKITLASHGAALIYKIYSERLKLIYENYVEARSVSLVAIAYRPSSLEIKRSNIHSAKEINQQLFAKGKTEYEERILKSIEIGTGVETRL